MEAIGNELRAYTATAVVVAEHFGVSRNTVYNWLESTDIPHRKIGGVIRFNLTEVDEWAKAGVPEDAA